MKIPERLEFAYANGLNPHEVLMLPVVQERFETSGHVTDGLYEYLANCLELNDYLADQGF